MSSRCRTKSQHDRRQARGVSADATTARDARGGPRNIEAYELLLRGRVLLAQRGPSIVRAAECFERALTLDPEWRKPHALFADANRLFAIYGMGRLLT